MLEYIFIGIYNKQKRRSFDLLFYSSLLSGFCICTFISPFEIVTSLPLWRASITVPKTPKQNNSPVAPKTVGSTLPVGGSMNEVTIRPTESIKQVQNAHLEILVYICFMIFTFVLFFSRIFVIFIVWKKYGET